MKIKVPIPNSLLRIGLLLMIIKVFFSFSSILEVSEELDMVVSVIACMFLAGSILQKAYPLKTLVVFAGVILLGILTSIRTGNLMMFIAIVTCLSLCREDLDRQLRFLMFWETVLVLLTTVIAVMLHLSGHSMLTKVSHEMLFNFGFSHPNVFSCIATNIFAMFLWLHYEDIRGHQLLAIGLLEILIYLITGSRTGLIVTGFLLACMLLVRGKNRFRKLLRLGAQWAPPVLTLLFYGLCRLYAAGNMAVRVIDDLVSGRIWLGAYSLNRFGVSLFGRNLSNVEVKWDEFWHISGITFDNVYTYLLVTQFVWLLVIMLLFFRLARRGDTKVCVFLLAWSLYGVSEIHVLNPYLFFAVLLVTELFDAEKYGRRRFRRERSGSI